MTAFDYNNRLNDFQNDWNSMAAAQWSARQQGLRDTPTMTYQDEDLARAAARSYATHGNDSDFGQWLGQQSYSKGWLPIERAAFQKTVTGYTPDEQTALAHKNAEWALRMQNELLQQQHYLGQGAGTKSVYDELRGIEGAWGHNPLEYLNYADPQTGIAKIPGRMMRNPENEYNPAAPPYIPGPETTVQAAPFLQRRIKELAAQMGYQEPAPQRTIPRWDADEQAAMAHDFAQNRMAEFSGRKLLKREDSAESIRDAFRRGEISREEAKKRLAQFGYQ